MTDAHTNDDTNPLQGYYEWQITTLMLAYDLVEPVPREDEAAAELTTPGTMSFSTPA